MAVILVVVAVLFSLLGLAGTETAQRLIPSLGPVPLVRDHKLMVAPPRQPFTNTASESRASPASPPPPAPVFSTTSSTAEIKRSREERRALLRLARQLRHELESCLLLMPYGSRPDRRLPTARYEQWSDSLITADEDGELVQSIRALYVLADYINDKLYEAAQSQESWAQTPLSNREIGRGRRLLEIAQEDRPGESWSWRRPVTNKGGEPERTPAVTDPAQMIEAARDMLAEAMEAGDSAWMTAAQLAVDAATQAQESGAEADRLAAQIALGRAQMQRRWHTGEW